jgi:hypothetical protein
MLDYLVVVFLIFSRIIDPLLNRVGELLEEDFALFQAVTWA